MAPPRARISDPLSAASTHQVDVTLHQRDGRYMASADLAEVARDIGVGDTPRDAVRAALAPLGEPYASEMADGVGHVDGRPLDT